MLRIENTAVGVNFWLTTIQRIETAVWVKFLTDYNAKN